MSDFLTERTVKITFDTAANDNSGVSNKTAAAHPSGVFIPDNSIITEAFYEVETTFQSATGPDNAQIAIHVEGANDIITAIAINGTGSVWDAGIHGCIVGYPNFTADDATHDTQLEVAALFAGTLVKTVDVEDVTFTVSVDALTAGKLHLYLTYIVGD